MLQTHTSIKPWSHFEEQVFRKRYELNYLPKRVVTTLFMSIQEEFCAIATRPKLVRKLEEYFGIDSHIELVQSKDLPLLCASLDKFSRSSQFFRFRSNGEKKIWGYDL